LSRKTITPKFLERKQSFGKLEQGMKSPKVLKQNTVYAFEVEAVEN